MEQPVSKNDAILKEPLDKLGGIALLPAGK